MREVRYPTVEGACEVARHLGIDPESIGFDCQDWQYTFPKVDQLPAYISLYQDCDLSDKAKRVLGCFIFQALDDLLTNGGSESVVRDTLEILSRDNNIHQCEFRYWALIDVDEEERGCPEDWFAITRVALEFVDRAE